MGQSWVTRKPFGPRTSRVMPATPSPLPLSDSGTRMRWPCARVRMMLALALDSGPLVRRVAV